MAMRGAKSPWNDHIVVGVLGSGMLTGISLRDRFVMGERTME
jgi:hypothetical protein